MIFAIRLGGYRQSSSGKAINADAACLAPKFLDLDAPLKFTLLCIIGSFSLHFLKYDAIHFLHFDLLR